MTVAQWIEMLKNYPTDKQVMIRTVDEPVWHAGVYVRPVEVEEEDDDVSIIITEVQD